MVGQSKHDTAVWVIQELMELRKEINAQIQEVRHTSSQLGITIYQLRDSHGNYIYTPLLVAKAEVTAAITRMIR